jgi:hypothetical protein
LSLTRKGEAFFLVEVAFTQFAVHENLARIALHDKFRLRAVLSNLGFWWLKLPRLTATGEMMMNSAAP